MIPTLPVREHGYANLRCAWWAGAVLSRLSKTTPATRGERRKHFAPDGWTLKITKQMNKTGAIQKISAGRIQHRFVSREDSESRNAGTSREHQTEGLRTKWFAMSSPLCRSDGLVVVFVFRF